MSHSTYACYWNFSSVQNTHLCSINVTSCQCHWHSRNVEMNSFAEHLRKLHDTHTQTFYRWCACLVFVVCHIPQSTRIRLGWLLALAHASIIKDISQKALTVSSTVTDQMSRKTIQRWPIEYSSFRRSNYQTLLLWCTFMHNIFTRLLPCRNLEEFHIAIYGIIALLRRWKAHLNIDLLLLKTPIPQTQG